ncbi:MULTISPECIES: AraC family transcriptional regulator [Actinomadura]|uniref:Helix-turn-helix domain-containing protein n=1 Tax=Actinomadura yumaensis TaxID=111807 RepID=A0ABW2CGY8_9ACTN|nr:AraC family transcriptional regulator [Actinomadura sp. J1-007]
MAASPVRLWRLDGLRGMQLMRAHFTRHAFARHGHETYALGVVQDGVEEIGFRDGIERVGAGGVVLIEPEVVHTGRAVAGDGWRYRVLYPSVELMTELGGGRGTPSFRDRIGYDRRSAELIVRAHRAAETEDLLTAESLLCTALTGLLLLNGTSRPVPARTAERRGSVARAHEILRERLLNPPSLEELAAETGARPFTLLRSFREAYGLPPHAFVTQSRVRNARRLLERGLPPAEVAAAVGFFDQAHLTRHFRRMVGVTPGAYQRDGNFVQAARTSPP